MDQNPNLLDPWKKAHLWEKGLPISQRMALFLGLLPGPRPVSGGPCWPSRAGQAGMSKFWTALELIMSITLGRTNIDSTVFVLCLSYECNYKCQNLTFDVYSYLNSYSKKKRKEDANMVSYEFHIQILFIFIKILSFAG